MQRLKPSDRGKFFTIYNPKLLKLLYSPDTKEYDWSAICTKALEEYIKTKYPQFFPLIEQSQEEVEANLEAKRSVYAVKQEKTDEIAVKVARKDELADDEFDNEKMMRNRNILKCGCGSLKFIEQEGAGEGFLLCINCRLSHTLSELERPRWDKEYGNLKPKVVI